MQIDPKVEKLIIFNNGGGIVERKGKYSVKQGLNEFEIQNVPASFDPNNADVKLIYLNPEDKDKIRLQQTIVSLPDPKYVRQLIDREKSAANQIISHSIDFTRELREKVSNICEASSYRTYSDMKGTFNFIIDSDKEGEVMVEINYFISDLRIKWETTLQIDLKDGGKAADLEAFIVIENQTGFSYNDVELGFAIFELPSGPETHPPTPQVAEAYSNVPEMSQAAFRALPKQKKTQRMKNLML
ncbi:MAG: hypothetical protein BAJALOKI2v1_1180003 [Promethearchaeota archaeon]|nr:MAG: hypothetical protein BAJALOKI2v1_1180003 [Candidatus Lokiarchaeota archaeon]